MKKLEISEMASIPGAGSKNCGNWWQTQWVISTCGLAGGMIGLAGGPLTSSVGSFAGSTVCAWICYYAC